MRGRAVAAWLGAAAGALVPVALPAQQAPAAAGQVQSPILTLDAERLFAETLFGRRVNAELSARTAELEAENERLAADLTSRERALTERRPTMDPDAFRAEADAFDADVQRIRSEQDAKEADLQDSFAEERQRFLNAVTPVLARLMIDSAAAVILERRDVFLSAGLVDITDEAIAAVDAALGDGATPAPESPAPESPAPAPESPSEAPADGGG